MMKVVFLLGIVALLTGCNFIQKDEFVITGTISSYPKDDPGGKWKIELPEEIAGTDCCLSRIARPA